MGQVVKVFRRRKPGSIYSAYAIPLLLMFSRRNATIHQYLSYWPNCTILASEGLSNKKMAVPVSTVLRWYIEHACKVCRRLNVFFLLYWNPHFDAGVAQEIMDTTVDVNVNDQPIGTWMNVPSLNVIKYLRTVQMSMRSSSSTVKQICKWQTRTVLLNQRYQLDKKSRMLRHTGVINNSWNIIVGHIPMF